MAVDVTMGCVACWVFPGSVNADIFEAFLLLLVIPALALEAANHAHLLNAQRHIMFGASTARRLLMTCTFSDRFLCCSHVCRQPWSSLGRGRAPNYRQRWSPLLDASAPLTRLWVHRGVHIKITHRVL